MSNKKRVIDYGINIGRLKKGKLNKITDVEGVRVGHCTIDNGEDVKTGVTIVEPLKENIFSNNLICASYVINGYGKTAGLVQIEELGVLESPIALTNTLNVGIVHDAICEYMIQRCDEEGVDITSFNPIVGECNDAYLNNIKKRAVKKEHVFKAFENLKIDFNEGDVGAGKGMSCHHLKGGIGSASRIIRINDKDYTLGVLVQSNHGKLDDLMINGNNIGVDIKNELQIKDAVDKGSIIIIMATDIPLSHRQLKRVSKRASVGLSRVGSYIGHGSGDIVISFSTANVIKKDFEDFISVKMIKEPVLDNIFRAMAESVEEAIINSMITAETVEGYKGNIRYGLKQFL